MKLFDGLKNLVANLGTDRDKLSGSHHVVPLLNDPMLEASFRGSWLARKIVEIPAKDALRKWRSWQASADQISAIEALENRLGLQRKVLEAKSKARLYGGAAIYIGTVDKDAMEPLNPDRIDKGALKHLTVIARKNLSAGEIETDPLTELYGMPRYYEISGGSTPARIHPSRLVLFYGNPYPDTQSGDVADGWSDSVLMAVHEAIMQADSTLANVASLIFEAKIDVISIPELMMKLQDPEFEKALLKRLNLAMAAKGINGSLILDAEEAYSQKSASFNSLRDLIFAFLQVVSGAADIPMTRLLGQSAAGLNTTGENDIRNYYDMVASIQSLEITPALSVLDECLIRAALGSRPPEIFYEWASLWQPTEKEKSEIGERNSNTISKLADTDLIHDQALAEAAVNMITESGVMPGLEAAVNKYSGGADLEDDLAAAMNDAKPRSLYVRRQVLNHSEISEWARSQGFESDLGTDMHVTIAYSRTPVDWVAMGEPWGITERQGRLTVNPGGPRVVEPLGDRGAVVLMFASDELTYRHENIRERGASWDHDGYQPHITITYTPGSVDLDSVEPYMGVIELGPEIFEAIDENWKSEEG